jgi:outer membrane protein assembly factor BamB
MSTRHAIIRTASVAVLVALGLALAAGAANAAESPSVPNYGAADPVPEAMPRYGAEDFRPTPEQPIGFQADGNGWYPGATPAVVEWWDGTPGWGKVAMRDGLGNNAPSRDGRTKEVEARVLLDRTPKNILWKVPTPGMSDSQPLVIGDRIVNSYWPHFVVCYDRQTGKELWRDELEVAFLPELQNDRKTIGPAPDPVEARRRQMVLELGWAMRILSYGLCDFDGEAPGPAEYPRVRWALDHLQRWRKVLEEADPKAVPVLDEDIALLKRFVAGEHDILGGNFKKVPQFGVAGGVRHGKGTLIEYAQDTVRASLRIVWPGWMPFHCTTGVSDGEIVVVQFFQGQVAAYEVSTGKRRWAWRDPVSGNRIGQGNDGAERVFSLRLKGDAVFVTMIPGDRGVSPGLFCLDKRNGSARWFVPYGPKEDGASIVTPVLMDISAGTQGAVPGQKSSWPMLIDARAAILEQATGRKVGQIFARGSAGVEQGKQIRDWFYPLVFGDRVIVGTGNDMGRHHSSVLHLRPDGQGNAEDLEEDRFVGKASRMPRVRNEHFVFGPDYAYDLRTRSTVGVGRAEKLAAIGDLCIGSGGFDDTKFRPRRDGAALLTWPVFCGTAKPHDAIRLISNNSLLGGADVPADRWVNKHLPGFDMLRLLAPRAFCGGYGNYVTAYFGHQVNGPVASGDRIFIQSQSFLYCIGPAVKGTTNDDPQVVTALRAETEVGKLTARLDDASAQYRYEAVKRLGTLKAPLAEATRQRLEHLLVNDHYEEIRAAAMLALDACDPAGEAGWKAFVAGEIQPCYGTDLRDPPERVREQRERRARLPLLFRCLGQTEGVALLSRRWPQAVQDPVQRRALLEVSIALQWRVEPMLADVLAALRKPTRDWDAVRRGLPDYLVAVDAASDPATAAFLLTTFPQDWTLYPSFARNLAPERLLAWIEPIALASSHPSNRGRILSAWRSVGAAALPSMERVRAAMAGRDPAQDRLAASYAEDIAKQIAEMKGEKKTTPPPTTPEAKKK